MLEVIFIKGDQRELPYFHIHGEGLLESYRVTTEMFHDPKRNIYTIASRDDLLKVIGGDVYFNDYNITEGASHDIVVENVYERNCFVLGEPITDEVTFTIQYPYITTAWVTREYLESLYERYGQEMTC